MDDLFLASSPLSDAVTWFIGGGPAFWTKEENKLFESALAVFDEDTPDRWLKVAAFIPGKSAWDVENKYKELLEDVTEIDAGRIPIPGYMGTFDLAEARDFDGCRKKPSGGGRAGDHERKKGVPWTEEEHRRFLMGLLKYGKGDWRSISRNFVISKTPTQVASHAQKYFIRQLSGGKDKRRPSIHDITTMSLVDSPNSAAGGTMDHQPSVLTTEQKLAVAQGLGINRQLPRNDGSFIIFESNHGNLFATDAFGLKKREGKPRDTSFRGSSMLGIHSSRHQAI